MDFKFRTQYFGLTDNSIYVLRNRFPIREIKSNELKKVNITRGTDVKRPALLITFGTILILVSFFLIGNFKGRKLKELGGLKSSGLILTPVFLLSFGGYSIYKASPIHKVLTLTMKTGEKESFNISDIIKKKNSELLITSLTKILGGTTIIIDKRLGL